MTIILLYSLQQLSLELWLDYSSSPSSPAQAPSTSTAAASVVSLVSAIDLAIH
jgi:hypothetical protein